MPINRTTLNALYDARPDERGRGRGLPRVARRAGRADPHVGGRGRQRDRARTLRDLLPRLHAQAMGARPERARQVGHGARAHPHQHRRSLFHRQFPGDAGRWLYRDVRARCSIIPTSRCCWASIIAACATLSISTSWSSPGRSTSISATATASCRIARCGSGTKRIDTEQFQPVATVNYPDEAVPYTRITEYKHLTGQVVPADQHHLRISDGRGRSLLPDPARGEPAAVQALRGAGRCRSRRDLRRSAGDLSLLQHGPGRRAGAGDLSQAARPAAAGGERGSGGVGGGGVSA